MNVMARRKSFDEAQVLDAAIDCFWRQGLKSASVRDLADQMGIAGPSLYNAYGCKSELFAKALERYADCQARPHLAELERENPPRQAILQFFSQLIDKASDRGESRGCLIVNTAIEGPVENADLREQVAAHLNEIQAFFLRNLEAGQADGAIPEHLDADDLAQMLMAFLLGLSAMARSQPDRSALEAALRPVFQLLDKPS